MSEKTKIEDYNLADSGSLMRLATDLRKFIKEEKLFTMVQEKPHVNVEAWQYAGARLGIFPQVVDVSSVEGEPGEIKYSCSVILLDLRSGHPVQVGSGHSVCSNREPGKKNYQEFAIKSMAQTRTVGRAFRNTLGWIIKAAGYEPTPMEEMDYMKKSEEKSTPTSAKPAPPKATAKQQTISQEVLEAPSGPPHGQVKKAASVKQKTELLILLNNKVITNEEKNKMIENINDLDGDRANQSIARLKKVIEEREMVQRERAGQESQEVA